MVHFSFFLPSPTNLNLPSSLPPPAPSPFSPTRIMGSVHGGNGKEAGTSEYGGRETNRPRSMAAPSRVQERDVQKGSGGVCAGENERMGVGRR
jgi:hypothetical protein